jgi:hypothetical protein
MGTFVVGRWRELAVIATAPVPSIRAAGGNGISGPRIGWAAAELGPASLDGTAVDRDRPNRVKLCPAVLGVVNVCADQRKGIANARSGQMPVIARHELDHQIAVLLGAVVRHQHVPVLRIQADQDVDVAAFLIAYVIDHARDPAAGIADEQAIRVVDPGEDPACIGTPGELALTGGTLPCSPSCPRSRLGSAFTPPLGSLLCSMRGSVGRWP